MDVCARVCVCGEVIFVSVALIPAIPIFALSVSVCECVEANGIVFTWMMWYMPGFGWLVRRLVGMVRASNVTNFQYECDLLWVANQAS